MRHLDLYLIWIGKCTLVVAFVAREVRVLCACCLIRSLLEVEAVACLESLNRVSHITIHCVVLAACMTNSHETSVYNSCCDVISDLNVRAAA